MLALVFALIAIAFLVLLVMTGFTIAPWLPSRKDDFKRVEQLAGLQPGQSFYELGCGDARVCRYIAEQNPEARVVGIELFFPIYLWAKFATWLRGPKNVTIKFGDARKQDLTDADVIYTFALPETINGGLKRKFERELKPGAKAISYVFELKEWDGVKVVDKPDKDASSIYIYSR